MPKTAKFAKDFLKSLLYYGADGLAYRVHALAPVQQNKALFVEMDEPAPTSDFTLTMQELKRRGFTCEFFTLNRAQGRGAAYAGRCVVLSWKAARVRLLLLRDASMPVGCLPIRPQTTVVQLWHACGAFKKFGYSTTHKLFGPDQREADKFPHYGNTTLATVSSPEVVWAYEEAMGLQGAGAVRPLGVSRTDAFFSNEQLRAWREQALNAVPAIQGKRVLLYAPTYRGEVTNPQAPTALDLELLHDRLGDGWAVLVKQHPLVAERPAIPASCESFVYDVTDVLPIEAAMVASNACVTDYSSLIFEYALLRRPLAFLAPDKDDYDDWRGFYYDYERMTPGPVFTTTDELADWLCGLPLAFDPAPLDDFCHTFMSACDGNATCRIVDAALGVPEHAPEYVPEPAHHEHATSRGDVHVD